MEVTQMENLLTKCNKTFQQDQNISKERRYKSTHHIWIVKAIMKKTDGVSKIKRFTYTIRAFLDQIKEQNKKKEF
jgi:hypothetical protein